MTLKKRFYITLVVSVILAVLSMIYKDTQHELHVLLNILLGGVLAYSLLFYVFQKGWLRAQWTNKRGTVIGYIVLICLLVFAVNMANQMDVHEGNFWVVNGNRWLADVLSVILSLLVFYLIFSWLFGQWEKIQTLKNEKSKAELALLKNQINPHFFFNTLNNLYALIKKNPEAAQEYVLKLSDIMRFTIYDGNEETVALAEEINYLSNFIELQTARYHRAVEVSFKHDIADKTRLVPPLLFITLLENAFKHGLEKLVDHAYIHAELRENDKGIYFSVKNNYDPETRAKTSGIGLQNLRNRLNLLYPDRHELHITDANDTFFAELSISQN